MSIRMQRDCRHVRPPWALTHLLLSVLQTMMRRRTAKKWAEEGRMSPCMSGSDSSRHAFRPTHRRRLLLAWLSAPWSSTALIEEVEELGRGG